jgi:hypothetical protein
MFQIVTRNSSFVIPRLWCRIAGCIETTKAFAVLAFPAAVWLAESTRLSFLQRQPALPVTGAAFPRPFAMRALSIRFSHR